jgi:hypothetical protein
MIHKVLVEVCSMRRSFTFILAALVVGVVGAAGVVAQTHNNEKKATDEVRFSRDTRVGNTVLKPGRYEVSCDTKTIKFSRIDVGPGTYTTVTKIVEMPCQGKELEAKRERTEVVIPVGPDGVQVLERLYLRGGNVEHVFPKH